MAWHSRVFSNVLCRPAHPKPKKKHRYRVHDPMKKIPSCLPKRECYQITWRSRLFFTMQVPDSQDEDRNNNSKDANYQVISPLPD